jgi:hypothetical protein
MARAMSRRFRQARLGGQLDANEEPVFGSSFVPDLERDAGSEFKANVGG